MHFRASFLIYCVVISVSQVYSQDVFNVYDSERSYENNAVYKREKFFTEQRAYPNNYIPDNAYQNALQQKLKSANNKTFTSPWISLGPESSTSQGNFYTGRVTFIQYDTLNPGTIYAGAANGGVWKTVDNGNNWFPVSDFLESLSSGAFAIDNSSNPQILYYGTGEAKAGFLYCYYGQGLFKSTNGGQTWKHITNGFFMPTYFSKIAVRPGHPNEVFAACGTNVLNISNHGGLYKSTDYGESWTRIIPIFYQKGARCDDIEFSGDGSRVYVTGANPDAASIWDKGIGYQVSTDGGNTFEKRYSSFNTLGRSLVEVYTNPVSGNDIVYIVTCSGPDSVSVSKSTDNGLTFTARTSYLYNGRYTISPWYNLCAKVNPLNPDNIFVGVNNIFKSTNSGADFVSVAGYFAGTHADMHSIEISPENNNNFLFASDGGIYRDSSGVKTSLYKGFNISQFYKISNHPFDSSIIMGGVQDNGCQLKDASTGKLWKIISGGDGGTVRYNSINPAYALMSITNSGEVDYSTDGGVNWGNSQFPQENFFWLIPIISDPSAPGVFYAAKQSVYKLLDGTFNWVLYADSINTGGTAPVIQQLAIQFSVSPAIIYASTGNFASFPGTDQEIYRTTEGSGVWTDLNASEHGLPNRYKTSITTDPGIIGEVVVTLSGFDYKVSTGVHVYRSTDFGDSWSNIGSTLPHTPVNDLVIYYDQSKIRYYIAATDVGVYITRADEDNWSELGSGLPNTVVMDLDIFNPERLLRAATHGRGVWEVSLSTLSENSFSRANNSNPFKFSLSQNYPNPFNPVTDIGFQIADFGLVSLIIYDVLGREVETLLNEVKQGGSYKLKWNAGNYPSGVYFYRLKVHDKSVSSTGDFIDSKKMVLVK